MLSRKYYKAIAEIIKDAAPGEANSQDFCEGNNHARYIIAEDLAKFFAGDNRSFDRNRFLNACGLDKD